MQLVSQCDLSGQIGLWHPGVLMCSDFAFGSSFTPGTTGDWGFCHSQAQILDRTPCSDLPACISLFSRASNSLNLRTSQYQVAAYTCSGCWRLTWICWAQQACQQMFRTMHIFGFHLSVSVPLVHSLCASACLLPGWNGSTHPTHGSMAGRQPQHRKDTEPRRIQGSELRVSQSATGIGRLLLHSGTAQARLIV